MSYYFWYYHRFPGICNKIFYTLGVYISYEEVLVQNAHCTFEPLISRWKQFDDVTAQLCMCPSRTSGPPRFLYCGVTLYRLTIWDYAWVQAVHHFRYQPPDRHVLRHLLRRNSTADTQVRELWKQLVADPRVKSYRRDRPRTETAQSDNQHISRIIALRALRWWLGNFLIMRRIRVTGVQRSPSANSHCNTTCTVDVKLC